MKHPSFILAAVAFTFAIALRGAETAAAPALAAPVAPATAVPSDENYRIKHGYRTYFADYLKLRAGKPADLIFIGDSITEQWRWGPGFPVWKKHFEDRALNFGLGSDRTQHVLWRLQNVELPGYAPKIAVVMIGTNNRDNSESEIAAGVTAVVDETKKRFSGIKVILVSILPNARANEKLMAVNERVRTLADDKTIFYLDLVPKFPAQGDNWKGLVPDKLHVSTEGYEVWAAELLALLTRVLEK